jgi:hypothetical protein
MHIGFYEPPSFAYCIFCTCSSFFTLPLVSSDSVVGLYTVVYFHSCNLKVSFEHNVILVWFC